MKRAPAIRLYHGGIAGLHPGDVLVPSPPHVFDGCPICVARSEGRVFTVGEYRAWITPHIARLGERGERILELLEGAPDSAAIDPPTGEAAIYVTQSQMYATWYAARSAGDLYRVKPLGRLRRSAEDSIESYVVPRARVLQVLHRGVRLSDGERADLLAMWSAADAQKSRAIPNVTGV